MRLPAVAQTGCCRVCSRAVESLDGEYLCEDCARRPPSYDRAACALRFEGKARDMILDFKFRRHLWLAADFSDWLEAAVRTRFDIVEIDLVVPMPTTLYHYWDRGYNQSEMLSRTVAQRIDRRHDAHILVRKGSPRRQSSLNESERLENARGTFAVRHDEMIRGRTVLVVDDIITTGATMSAAADALKEHGASRIFAAALARSVRS